MIIGIPPAIALRKPETIRKQFSLPNDPLISEKVFLCLKVPRLIPLVLIRVVLRPR
jgi:hypothetical protein